MTGWISEYVGALRQGMNWIITGQIVCLSTDAVESLVGTGYVTKHLETMRKKNANHDLHLSLSGCQDISGHFNMNKHFILLQNKKPKQNSKLGKTDETKLEIISVTKTNMKTNMKLVSAFYLVSFEGLT